MLLFEDAKIMSNDFNFVLRTKHKYINGDV